MMILTKKMIQGFTLIEMLLVMVIISVIIFASTSYIVQKADQARIDRAGMQMQQILNAGLSYYIDNGKWPGNGFSDLTPLQGSYLPPASVTFNNPWGYSYYIFSYAATPPPPPNPRLFYVYTQIVSTTAGTAGARAQAISGLLPMGYISPNAPTTANPPAPGSCAGTTSCWVVASVNIPGQNINNARAMNFAGLYHHGACVPVPDCPVDVTGKQMQPEVIVVPVSVSGVNYNSDEIYPISSFTAYATSPPATNPPPCSAGATQKACGSTTDPTGQTYWRTCLQIVTEVGDVKTTRAADQWGNEVTLAAFTRCAVANEPSGSGFNIYTN